MRWKDLSWVIWVKTNVITKIFVSESSESLNLRKRCENRGYRSDIQNRSLKVTMLLTSKMKKFTMSQ